MNRSLIIMEKGVMNEEAALVLVVAVLYAAIVIVLVSDGFMDFVFGVLIWTQIFFSR